MRLFTIGLMICLACAAVCMERMASRATAAEDPAFKVRQSVRGLNSPELTERDKAEKAILDLGPAALVLLPENNERMPAEVIDRLNRIRQALLKQQVEAGAQASLVTMDVKDVPLAEVLALLSKQSGNRIVDHREAFGEAPREIKITLACDKAPFWQTLDQVLDQAKLDVYNYGAERGIYVINRPVGRLPRQDKASYSGPFRIAPTRFEALADLQNPRNRSLKLFLDVTWEPRLHPINILQPLSRIHAASPEGALAVDGAQGEPEASVGRESTTVEMQIPLESPPRKVEKISVLKGRFNALVPGPAEEFRFASLPASKTGENKHVEQHKASVTVTVDQVRKNNDVWELQVRVKFDKPGEALESHRSWIYDNEAYLEDAKGQQTLPGGYEQTRQTKDEVGVKYLFDLPAGLAGQTLVYKTPLAIMELPIDYELSDLPLP